MKYIAPHPDDISRARFGRDVSHASTKLALRRGFKYPLLVTFSQLRYLMRDHAGDVNAAVLSCERKIQLMAYGRQRRRRQDTIWFKDAAVATYVKLII
jgi:hypothetical protein